MSHQFEIHTHIHHHIHTPAMTTDRPTAATNASTATELEALVALVARLSTLSMEGVRLAAEVQAKLPAVVAAEVVHARASATAAATAAAASPLWVRGVPLTPTELEQRHPEGSGETWYVVICGREPGLYRTSAEADAACNGVPHQVKAKKTSRREALAWYRQEYRGPAGDGVQKWVEM
ncbi:hypothetical protein K438DRAFT_1995753 [Mycena galopus ATCC 62051]|nr:hypothetical protein K438DRAFT_1995753 [Mycena galopus ATCC 62051]